MMNRETGFNPEADKAAKKAEEKSKRAEDKAEVSNLISDLEESTMDKISLDDEGVEEVTGTSYEDTADTAAADAVKAVGDIIESGKPPVEVTELSEDDLIAVPQTETEAAVQNVIDISNDTVKTEAAMEEARKAIEAIGEEDEVTEVTDDMIIESEDIRNAA